MGISLERPKNWAEFSLDDSPHAVVSNKRRADIRRSLSCDSFPAGSRHVFLCLLTTRHRPSRASLGSLFPARFAHIPYPVPMAQLHAADADVFRSGLSVDRFWPEPSYICGRCSSRWLAVVCRRLLRWRARFSVSGSSAGAYMTLSPKPSNQSLEPTAGRCVVHI